MIDLQINAEEEFDYIQDVAETSNISEGKPFEEPMEDEVEIHDAIVKVFPPIRELKVPILEKYKNKTLDQIVADKINSGDMIDYAEMRKARRKLFLRAGKLRQRYMKKRTIPIMDLRMKLKISRARALQRAYTRSGPVVENRIKNFLNRKVLKNVEQSFILSRPNKCSVKERLGSKCFDGELHISSNEDSDYNQPPCLIPAEMWPSFDRPAVLVPNEIPRMIPPLIPCDTWEETRRPGSVLPDRNLWACQGRFESAPVMRDSSEQIKSEVISESVEVLYDYDQTRQSQYSPRASCSGYAREQIAESQSRNTSRSYLSSDDTSTGNRLALAQDRGSFQHSCSPQRSKLDMITSNYGPSSTGPQFKKVSTSERFSESLHCYLSTNPSTRRASVENQSLKQITGLSPASSFRLPNREELIPHTPLLVPDTVAENSAAPLKLKVFCTNIPLGKRFEAYAENYNNIAIKEEQPDSA